ncbi:MAG: MOSC N-terminal beta barrel domain-containing protein [Cyanobacteria bacterium SBLK]|nr:MOSC N-terminal beta barrel domain-containing protein [Cyanobacteria bacterium SBLK]
MIPTLSHILIFPIKSLDGVSVQQARILQGGALEYDREFAIVDARGKFVNGKRTAKIHQLRSQFDLSQRTMTISVQGNDPQTFSLDRDRKALAQWLSQFLGFTVELQQNRVTGFPDDRRSPGPTIISTATLETLSSWFSEIDVESMRSRFRTNLEFSDTPPFWEDILYEYQSQGQSFAIGRVAVQGINPCQRCIVPTRDPITGEATSKFQKTLAMHRRASLPEWADEKIFNHYYRIAVNTCISVSETGKVLQIGDFCKR